MYRRAGFLRVSILSSLVLGIACDAPEPDDVEALEQDDGLEDEDEEVRESSPDELINEEPVSELAGTPICNRPHWCTSNPNPTYTWTSVPGAVNYRFVLFKYVNGMDVQITGKNVVPTSTQDVWLQPNTLYRWKVKGEGAGGADPGPYCINAGNYFYYDATCPWWD